MHNPYRLGDILVIREAKRQPYMADRLIVVDILRDMSTGMEFVQCASTSNSVQSNISHTTGLLITPVNLNINYVMCEEFIKEKLFKQDLEELLNV